MSFLTIIPSALLLIVIIGAVLAATDPAHNVENTGPRVVGDFALFYGYEIDFHDLVDDKYFVLKPSNKMMSLTFYSDGNYTKTIQKVK